MTNKLVLPKKLLCLLIIITTLSGCERENLNDKPLSYWIDYHDSCVSGMAKAISESGLPYPYKTVVNEKTGKEEQRAYAKDLWLGAERYVIPIEYASTRDAYSKSHPYRHMALSGGSLPNYYPAGPRAGVKDGMASRVDVRFQCSMDESYEKSVGYRSNEEGIRDYTKRMQERADGMNKVRKSTAAHVSVSVRDDLAMTEVLYEKGITDSSWMAGYLPLDNKMISFDGSVSSIDCDKRHDPVERRYGNRGWRCASALRVNKNVSAIIEIYVSHLPAMPAIHQQVKQLLMDSKQTD